jgi:hypothetical protein
MSGNIIEIGPLRMAQQIARLNALLEELEDLSRDATLLVETRASIDEARSVLKECADDPQPEVDRDMMERMYRVLKTGRRPPER